MRSKHDIPSPAIAYGFSGSQLGWAIWRTGAGEVVDYLRSGTAAAYAVRELTAGRAHIEPHLPVGCRVQPGAA